jgi:hypothetical protein
MTLVQKLAPLAVLALLAAACGGGAQTSSTRTTTSQPSGDGPPTMVRFVHAIPDGPSVDALVGEWEVASDLGYRQFGAWREVPSGRWDVTLRRGEGIELTETYRFEPNERYWIFAWGSLNPRGPEQPAALLIEAEEDHPSSTDETWLRFVNVVTEGQPYGLVVTTGGSWNLLFPNQAEGTISEFKLAPVYNNTFELIPARDTSLPAVTDFDLNLQVGILYTIVAAGRARGDMLEVFHIAESAAR